MDQNKAINCLSAILMSCFWKSATKIYGLRKFTSDNTYNKTIYDSETINTDQEKLLIFQNYTTLDLEEEIKEINEYSSTRKMKKN